MFRLIIRATIYTLRVKRMLRMTVTTALDSLMEMQVHGQVLWQIGMQPRVTKQRWNLRC
jgi:hypothetical protein